MRSPRHPLPSTEEIRAAFEYDPRSGVMRWLAAPVREGALARIDRARNTLQVGKAVGCDNGLGYLRVLWKGRHYVVHRLAWKHFYGSEPAEIDHVNGARSDNRIANLREATPSQNTANTRLRTDNKSGLKGVRQKGDKWIASTRKDGRNHYLGAFQAPHEAYAAYRKAAAEKHGEFHRPL